MSKTPSFPLFVARTPSGAGCGHQHKQAGGAIACARTILVDESRKRRPLDYLNVVKVTKTGETLVERIEAE